jgi:copper resistance protein C
VIRRPLAALAALALLILPQLVSAHAVVVGATPAVDSSVSGKNLAVRLQFNSRIDAKRSRLTLFSPDGTERHLSIRLDDEPNLLGASAGNLLPGGYRIRWQVLSVDGHISRGEIPFKVTVAGEP